MSLDEAENSLWEIVIAINALRNELAHALATEKRQRKLDRVKELYLAAVSHEDFDDDERLPDANRYFGCGILPRFYYEI